MSVKEDGLKQLGFLTIGLFDPSNPIAGNETTLKIIELGENLGFDSAWVRHRHMQFGISSPLTVLAAASQRTSRIKLGTAVIPLGLENPLRLAEDLATVDVLSHGRLNPGVSVGVPMNYEAFKEHLYPDTAEIEDFTYVRVDRLIHNLSGGEVSTLEGRRGIEEFSKIVQPHSPSLIRRLWYGGASERSAIWAGQKGLNFLSSNVMKSPGSLDFAQIQHDQYEKFYENHPLGTKARASQGLVVIPTDNATPSQIKKYQDYVDSRYERTLSLQGGPAQILFARDLIGTGEEIAQQLKENIAYQLVDEVVFALPFSFAEEDYIQIISDIAGELAPRLGWKAQALQEANN